MIDVHTHPICRNEGQGPARVAGFMARAASHGIKHMVALGDVLVNGRSPSARQVAAINDETMELVKAHPATITGFCYLNPTLGENHVWREVERAVAAGLRGIKLEIANNARDACMKPVMAAAERFNLVVLQHAWSMTNIHQRRYHTDPEDVALLARRFPSVRIIMAHLTGCGIRGVLAARGLENLWIDTSGAAPESGLVEYAVEKVGVRRILYGSDAPIRDFAVALARVTGADLSAGERRRILHDNARELLRLP